MQNKLSLHAKSEALIKRNEFRSKSLNSLKYFKYKEEPTEKSLIFVKQLKEFDVVVNLDKCLIHKRKDDKEFQFEGLFITSFMKILNNFEDKNLFNNLLTVVQTSNSDKITNSLFEAFKQKLRSFEKGE